MKWKLYVFISMLSISYDSSTQEPQERYTFSALEFTGVVQQNQKGAFDYFFDDLQRRANIDADYHVMSPARGAKAFFEKTKHCLIPSSKHAPYFEGFDVIHSKSFAEVHYLAFTLADQPTITEKSQMAGKVIGVIRDEKTWDYEKRFGIENVTYLKVGSLESLVEMLYRKRIDVAIHDHSDFLLMIDHVGHKQPNFSKQNPMAVDKIVITCHNTASNRALINKVNPYIQNILDEGLKQYYDKASIN